MKSIHWFRHDLRVQDNIALSEINKTADQLLCVYVIDSSSAKSSEFIHQTLHKSNAPVNLSDNRKQFLYEALVDLQTNLNKMGQKLFVVCGDPVEELKTLIEKFDVKNISSAWHCGTNERKQWDALQDTFTDKTFIQENGGTLYEESSLPFAIENMPDTFSPFRRKVEKYCDVDIELTHIDDIAPPFEIEYSDCSYILKNDKANEEYTGGASAAIARIQEYLWQTDHIASYKETRNGLDGWDFSSRFSAWLSIGCISPKQILIELKRYENERTKNDSTYWLFFELLWREFFHWQLFKHNHLFFKKSGVQGKSTSTSFDASKFAEWTSGTTGFKIIDACMRQLNATGFMSNRGRQLVASCFVHELNLDWRYGAAYFEHKLIDFDVASNYGNWQYLAGVGADPRGHRQFNLNKQTEIYDPRHDFINAWIKD